MWRGGSTSQGPQSSRPLTLKHIEALARSKATVLLTEFAAMRASPLALQRLVPRNTPAHLAAEALSEALYFRLACMGAWMRVSVLLLAGQEYLPAVYEIMTSHLQEQLEDKLWKVEEKYDEDFPEHMPHPETIRQHVRKLAELKNILDDSVLETLEDAEELQECIDALRGSFGDTDGYIPDPFGLDDQFCELRCTLDYALRDADLESLVPDREALGDRTTMEKIWRSLDEAARRTYRDGRYKCLELLVLFSNRVLSRLREDRQREIEKERLREQLRERGLPAEDDEGEPVVMRLCAMRYVIDSGKIEHEEPESLPRYFVKRRLYEKVWEIIFSHGRIKGRIKPEDLEKALVEIGFTKQQRKGSAVSFEHPDKDLGRPSFSRHESVL